MRCTEGRSPRIEHDTEGGMRTGAGTGPEDDTVTVRQRTDNAREAGSRSRAEGSEPIAEKAKLSMRAEGFSFGTRSGPKQCDCAAETVLEDASRRMTPTAGCTSGLGDAGDRNPKG